MPEEKSNTTVVTKEREYSGKLTKLIGDGNYNKIKKEPILKCKSNLSQILNMKIHGFMMNKWADDPTLKQVTKHVLASQNP